MGGFWEKEGGGGGYHEEAVLVVHPVLGQDSGQEVKTRGPVESCNVCSLLTSVGKVVHKY